MQADWLNEVSRREGGVLAIVILTNVAKIAGI